MSETIDPPTPLPPAEPPAGLPPYGPPPAGWPYGPGYPAWQQPPTPRTGLSLAQIGAAITVFSGIITTIAVFLPAFNLSGYNYYEDWSMSRTPDAIFFTAIGVLIVALGCVRFAVDHIVTRVCIILIALYAIKVAMADAYYGHQAFLDHSAGSGITFTFGPALFMFGVASVGAIVSSCLVTKTVTQGVNR